MTDSLTPTQVFKCLADENRIRMMLLIAREEELCVCELTCALDESQPKVSRHLAQLRTCGLLEDRRQGQWVYYRLHPKLPAWVREILVTTLEANRQWLSTSSKRLDTMGDRPSALLPAAEDCREDPMKVLFLCTANSCRSILSEAVFNHLAPAGMKAYSAGSQPKGEVNPLSITALQRAGIATNGLSSKSTDSHADLAPDFVITVCDKAAGEACPVFFGPAVKAHWGLADPSDLQGSEEEMDAAFDDTLGHIKRRISALLALPFEQLDAAQLKAELARIGTL